MGKLQQATAETAKKAAQKASEFASAEARKADEKSAKLADHARQASERQQKASPGKSAGAEASETPGGASEDSQLPVRTQVNNMLTSGAPATELGEAEASSYASGELRNLFEA